MQWPWGEQLGITAMLLTGRWKREMKFEVCTMEVKHTMEECNGIAIAVCRRSTMHGNEVQMKLD